jgi:hypothetical protein
VKQLRGRPTVSRFAEQLPVGQVEQKVTSCTTRKIPNVAWYDFGSYRRPRCCANGIELRRDAPTRHAKPAMQQQPQCRSFGVSARRAHYTEISEERIPKRWMDLIATRMPKIGRYETSRNATLSDQTAAIQTEKPKSSLLRNAGRPLDP